MSTLSRHNTKPNPRGPASVKPIIASPMSSRNATRPQSSDDAYCKNKVSPQSGRALTGNQCMEQMLDRLQSVLQRIAVTAEHA